MKRILFLFLSLTFVAGTSFADIVVSEDFTTDTGSLISTGGPGDAALTTVTAGTVVFNDTGDGGRAFIGTAGSDFASVLGIRTHPVMLHQMLVTHLANRHLVPLRISLSMLTTAMADRSTLRISKTLSTVMLRLAQLTL